MKHSPGPFRVGASRACEIEILDAKGCEVARVDIPITADRSIDPCDVQAANVKLLTAAPDLLAACHKSLEWLGHLPGFVTAEEKKMNAAFGLVEIIKDAIQKAEGVRPTQYKPERQSAAITRAGGAA